MGISERKQRERERRANDILDAAVRVFLAREIAGTTVDAIALEAEISKGTIYLYFKSKDEIAYALLLREFSRIFDRLSHFDTGSGSGLDKLLAICRFYLGQAEENPQQFKLFYKIHRHFHSNIEENLMRLGESELGRNLLAVTERLNSFLSAIIMEGMRDGSLRPDLDPVFTVMMVSGILDGVLENVPFGATPEVRARVEQLFGIGIEALFEKTLGFIRDAIAVRPVATPVRPAGKNKK